jgi:hypothetical protein
MVGKDEEAMELPEDISARVTNAATLIIGGLKGTAATDADLLRPFVLGFLFVVATLTCYLFLLMGIILLCSRSRSEICGGFTCVALAWFFFWLSFRVFGDWNIRHFDMADAVQAIELEMFAKEIPELLRNGSSLYSFFKSGVRINHVDMKKGVVHFAAA